MRYRLACTVLVMLGIVGCASSDDPSAAVAAMNDSNLKRIANLYGAYQEQHEWRGPRDEAAFKDFARKMPSRNLEMMRVDPNNLDALFVSDRDGKPFKIQYSVLRPDGQRGPKCAVVFEEVGTGGKRQVGFTNGSVEEVDDTRYDQLWKNPTDQSSSAGSSHPSG